MNQGGRGARSPGQSSLRRRSCGSDGLRFDGEAEVLEDLANAVRIVNGSEECAPAQAVGAGQHIGLGLVRLALVQMSAIGLSQFARHQ